MAVTFLTNGEQTLTEEQKAQARENIGAGDGLSLHDIILDKSSPAELEGSDESYPFPCREWEKRADGTFWMRAVSWFEIYPETVVLSDWTFFPFAPIEVNSASLVPIFYSSDEKERLETEAIVATLLPNFEGSWSEADGMYVGIEATDETYEKLSEYGYEGYDFEGEIYIEGRWRVE